MFAVLGFALLTYLPDFRASSLPCHDALQCESAFQIYYSSLLHENDLPLWLPYGQYGMISATVMMYVTPVGYFVGALARIFSATDTLLLFKIVVLLEFLLFCAGSFKLAALLYRRNESILFVSIGAVLSFSWLASLDSSFHTYYMLPFILRHLTLFLNTGKVRQLWLTGIFCVVSCIGNIPYYPPLLALVLFLYCAAMIRTTRLTLRKSDLIFFAVFVVGAAAFLGSYILNFEGLTSYSSGRDPETKKVFLHVFLTYAGVSKLRALLPEMLTGVYTHGDTTFFIGLAPLVLAVYAFVNCKRRESLAITVLGVFLVLFSFGGVVALLAYHFPGMALYRHVALVFGQAKYLLLLVAGFGLDHWLAPVEMNTAEASTPQWQVSRHNCIRAFLLGIAALELVLTQYGDPPHWGFVLFPEKEEFSTTLARLGLRLGVYAFCLLIVPLLRNAKTLRFNPRQLVHLLLFAYLFDIWLYKAAVFTNWPASSPEDIAESRVVFQARKLPYRETREHPLKLEYTHKDLYFLVNQGASKHVPYSHFYMLAGLDPCIPIYRTDFLTDSVANLFRMSKVPFYSFPVAELLPADNEFLLSAIGCGAPKVKLLGDGGNLGDVRVTEFGPNYLKAAVNITTGSPVHLYYADSLHPGWHGFINGQEAPIVKANIAFKAIKVPRGASQVEFRFFNGWGSRCFYILAFVSVGFALYFLIFYCREEHLPDGE